MKNIETIEKNNTMGDYLKIALLGARVMSLSLNGTNLLREANVTNPKRSGIPILGPIVDANVGIWQTLAPKMPQHGTDRMTQWNVTDETETSTTLIRTYDGLDHPLRGEAEIRIAIDQPHIFTLVRTTRHRGHVEVPLGTGLHTYFLPQAQFPTLKVFPLKDGKTYLLPGMTEIPMRIDDKNFMITAVPVPSQTAIWAENSKDHICVEPWWAEIGNAPMIKPGEIRVESYSIRLL